MGLCLKRLFKGRPEQDNQSTNTSESGADNELKEKEKIKEEAVTKAPFATRASKRFQPMDNPEEFYGQFKFIFQEPQSSQDKELLAREEKPEDRILDLLIVMDCTSSMTYWLNLCKVSTVKFA